MGTTLMKRCPIGRAPADGFGSRMAPKLVPAMPVKRREPTGTLLLAQLV